MHAATRIAIDLHPLEAKLREEARFMQAEFMAERSEESEGMLRFVSSRRADVPRKPNQTLNEHEHHAQGSSTILMQPSARFENIS